jgi:folate-dependent phosphoribosylglycinamide formyltransferase PurN
MTDTSKIFFLCRDSSASRFIAQALWQKGFLSGIIVENDHLARKKKISRLLKCRTRWRLPVAFLDLAVLVAYSRYMDAFLGRKLSPGSHFPDVKTIYVDSINGDDVSQLLDEQNPDALVVHGTSIIGEKLLSKSFKTILNIHGGIVPEYRNVHSEFWALYNRDYQKVGTTIMHLDRGVDTGAIALSKTVEIQPAESIFSVKEKNTRLAASLINEALELLHSGILPRVSQGAAGVAYRTPTALNIVALGLRGHLW